MQSDAIAFPNAMFNQSTHEAFDFSGQSFCRLAQSKHKETSFRSIERLKSR
jgi:hypothetical protein